MHGLTKKRSQLGIGQRRPTLDFYNKKKPGGVLGDKGRNEVV